MKSFLLFLALMSSLAFAGEVDLVVDPKQPQLHLEDGSVIINNSMERILVAPWFGAKVTVYNDHGRDVVLTHIQLDITASNGQFMSVPGTYISPTELPANGVAEIMAYADFLPKGDGLTYSVVAHLKGWFGNLNKVEEDLDRTTTFLVK